MITISLFRVEGSRFDKRAFWHRIQFLNYNQLKML